MARLPAGIRLSMPGDEVADDALLAASAAGDVAAFRALVERHSGPAHGVATRLTGSRVEAQDIVQEAFLRAWREAGRWRGGVGRFPAWLYRVVLNLSRDRARAARHRRHAVLDEAFEIADPAPLADAVLAGHDDAARLRAAISDLPERQRQALVLTYAGGLSNVDAALTLGVSVGALESLLVRARRELRRSLRETQDD